MDKFCERMLVFAFDGKESLSNSHYHLMDCSMMKKGLKTDYWM